MTQNDNRSIIPPTLIIVLFLVSIVVLALALAGCRSSSGPVQDARHTVGFEGGARVDRWQVKVRGEWHTLDPETFRRCPVGARYPACKGSIQ